MAKQPDGEIAITFEMLSVYSTSITRLRNKHTLPDKLLPDLADAARP